MSAAFTPQALGAPIARELNLPEAAVIGVLELLATGAQPVFLCRYRREHVGPLALRDLERVQARAVRAVAFELKRQQTRAELAASPRWNDELAELVDTATHPVHLEDVSAGSRRRKRGAASRARGRGLGTLASLLWASGSTGRLAGEEPGPADADPLELARQNPGRPPAPRKKSAGKRKRGKKKPDAENEAQSAEAPEASDAEPSDAEPSVDASETAQATESVDVQAVDEMATVDAAGESVPAANDVVTGTDTSEAGSPDESGESASTEAAAEPTSSDAVAADEAAVASAEPQSAEGDDAPASEASEASAANDEDEAAPTDSEAQAADASEPPEEATPPRPPSPEQDLASARIIVGDDAFDVPLLVRRLRDLVLDHGTARATVVPGKKDKGGRYAKLAGRVEPLAKATPSYLLGLLRGEREGGLQVHLEISAERFDAVCDEVLGIDAERPCGAQLRDALREAWQGPSGRSVRQSVRVLLKRWADRQAIGEFCDAYRSLLLAPPFGRTPVLAIDPGFEPGCRVAVLDGAGAVLAQDTVFPLQPKLQAPQAKARIAELAAAHGVTAIVVTNGNGGRDIERLCREVIRETEGLDPIIVATDGDAAGLLGSSRALKQELPNADTSVRRAIAAGRRVQDPLAALVNVDARKLGLGQHQHEVDQEQLRAALEQVLVSCVNEVGVDPNVASLEQLTRVVGFNHALAQAIVTHREEHGPFRSRQALQEVPGLEGKTFEQSAGFLRIEDGDQPLDRTAIHPERYALVTQIAGDLGVTVGDLVGNAKLVDTIDAKRYLSGKDDDGEQLGRATFDALLEQLRKPGLDPRPAFEPVEYDSSLEKFEDLTVGMELPGVVTHLAKFGAFIDVGLPQEGLVHVSELTHGFISGPAEAVYVGQRVKGRVIEIAADRKRFSMSLRALMPRPEGQDRPSGKRRRRNDGDDRGDRSGKGKRGRGNDRDRGRGGPGGRRGGGGGGGNDRGSSDRVLGFKLDLSELAKQLKD